MSLMLERFDCKAPGDSHSDITEKMQRAVAYYREFAPCKALREHGGAFFSFVPRAEKSIENRPIRREVVCGEDDSFSSPLFADGHVSMVFSFGRACHAGGLWYDSPAGPHGKVIGAMSGVGPTSGEDRPEMLGVYFRPGRVSPFTHVPAWELTDRIVALEDLWGAAGSELPTEVSEANEAARIDRLESVLLARIEEGRRSTIALDAAGLAAWVLRRCGRLTVQSLADAAGVSRQHLTRTFRECVGVTPKLYCRLARFQSGLVYAGCGKTVNWAQVAIEMGYADQSHMITEFRRFSSLTPPKLATQQWFHPFIERARAMSRARDCARVTGYSEVMLPLSG